MAFARGYGFEDVENAPHDGVALLSAVVYSSIWCLTGYADKMPVQDILL